MSYQEIKKIGRGRKWLMVILIFVSVLTLLTRKVVRAGNTITISGRAFGNSQQRPDGSSWTCAHQYTINHIFKYYKNSREAIIANNSEINKCEPLFVEASGDNKTSIWTGSSTFNPPPPPPEESPVSVSSDAAYAYGFGVACGACGACGGSACACDPPADFLDCTDQMDCLNKGTAWDMYQAGWKGKGVFKNAGPVSFNAVPSNNYIQCSNNQCVAYAGGNYTLEAVMPTTKYYGQCSSVAENVSINIEGDEDGAKDHFNVTVQNQAPTATVSFAKSPIKQNEEVDVTCKAVDPDCASDPAHQDKIAKIKWTCVDGSGSSTDCGFKDPNSSGWSTGSANQDIPASQQSNPYSSTVKFKAAKVGDYDVTCEAWDNDPNNPMSGVGVDRVKVGDTDLGVVGAHFEPGDAGEKAVNTKTDSGEKPASCVFYPDRGSDNPLCAASGDINYKSASKNIDPDKYEWKCGDAQNEGWKEGSDSFKCNYKSVGVFTAALQIADKSGKTTSCRPLSPARIVNQPKCIVKARKIGSSAIEDFTDQLSVDSGDEVEFEVKKECLEGKTTEWFVNGVKQSGKDSRFRTTLNTQGKNKVESRIGAKVDGAACEVSVDVKESVRFR